MTRLADHRDLFRSILCPVDFSALSKVALQHAAAFAKRSGGRLTVLYASDPLLTAAAAPDQRSLARTTDVELRAFVGEALGSSSGGSVARLLAKGDPAEEIEKVVRRTPVDLIVMGTQGLSGASRVFFGSTTERVLRRATVPVLAVPRGARPSALPASRSNTRILAALELGRHMTADAHKAADIARWWQTDLILVHVVKPMQAPRWLRTHLRDRDRVMLDEARTRLERIARGLGADPRIDCEVRLGDPAEQVSALAADARASLVVVILRARPGFLATPQGTTTYRVLCGTGTAVLAIPNRWRSRISRAAR